MVIPKVSHIILHIFFFFDQFPNSRKHLFKMPLLQEEKQRFGSAFTMICQL